MSWRLYKQLIRHFSTTVYINNRCLELEKLFLQSNDPEQILSLLVTHRPNLYLHNAVRAIELLAQKSNSTHRNLQKDNYKSHLHNDNAETHSNNLLSSSTSKNTQSSSLNDVSNCLPSQIMDIKTASHPENMDLILTRLSLSPESLNAGLDVDPRDWIVKDERYLLLLSDIYLHRNNLDVGSICNIVQSLRDLNHSHYPLLNGLLHPLIKQLKSNIDNEAWHHLLGSTDVDMAIKQLTNCAKNFSYFGYRNTELYNIISTLIMNLKLSVDNFMGQIHIYSNVDNCTQDILHKLSEFAITNQLSPRQMSYVSYAIARHSKGSNIYDHVFEKIVDSVINNVDSFKLDDLYRISTSTISIKLHYLPLIKIASRELEKQLDLCTRAALKPPLTISQISKLVESLSYFGTCGQQVISTTLTFLEDYIDDITPSDALRILNSICFTKSENVNTYMLNFIWRKIGADVSWERSSYEIFVLWLYHLFKFPWITYNLPKRCIDEGFRQWVIHNSVIPDHFDQLISEHANVTVNTNTDCNLNRCHSSNEDIELPEPTYPFTLYTSNDKGLLFISDYPRNDKKLPGGVDLIRTILLRDIMDVELIRVKDWERWTLDQKRSNLTKLVN